MAGNQIGGVRARNKTYEKYGDDFYKRIGALGGRKCNPRKGFGTNRGLAHYAGTLGGLRSRKGKMKIDYRTKEMEKAYKHLMEIKVRAEQERTRRLQNDAMKLLQ